MTTIRDTQLTSDFNNYDTKNMIFSDPVVGTIGSTVPITFRRIIISTTNPDGSVGDLIIPVSGFSFGVSQNMDFNTGKPNGYVLPVCLTTKGAVRDEETQWIESFNRVIKKCKEHLLSIKKDIQKYDLEESDMRKLNPIYYKRVNGEIDPNSSPTLYVKLIVSKDKTTGEQKIKTLFYNQRNESINPLDILGKYCNVNCALKIESIFIGNKISMQIKLYEVEVALLDTGMKRLLGPVSETPKKLINSAPKTVTSVVENKATDDVEDDDEDTGSIVDDDDEDDDNEEEPVVVEEPPKKTVKKVKKIVKKVKKIKKGE